MLIHSSVDALRCATSRATAPRASRPPMPGIVNLHIWKQTPEGLQLIQERSVVVFGAMPGTPWSSFASFMRSLSSEYGTTCVQLSHEGEQAGRTADRPPDLSRASVFDVHSTLRFPMAGCISIILILASPSSTVGSGSPLQLPRCSSTPMKESL